LVEYTYYPLTANIDYQPVICIEGFITTDDLDRLTKQLKTTPTMAAIVGNDNTPVTDEGFEERRIAAHKIRKSNVSFLNGSEWNWLYDKLVLAVNHANITNYHKTLYGITPLQYSEYDSKYNGFYGPHLDVYPRITDGMYRSLSFSLQITPENDYEGGDVKIFNENIVYVANKKLGSITFFDSKSLHEVTPVTSGFRRSIVGWILGPRV